MTIETLAYQEGFERALKELELWITDTNLNRFSNTDLLALNSKEILERIKGMKVEDLKC
jgi:hypothetical protein